MVVELCCQLTGRTQRRIVTHFGYTSESSVGKQRNLLAVLVRKDADLSGKMQALKRHLLDAKF